MSGRRSRSRSLSRSRSRSSSRKKDEGGERKDGDRRRSRSNSRKRKRRSSSRSSSNGRRNIDDIVRNSLASHLSSVLAPIQKQLAEKRESDYAAEIQELKAKQEQLLIETKAAALNSNGAQSQFRCVANLMSTMKKALLRSEEALLMFESPEDEIYQAFSPICDDLKKGIAEAEERLDLITKADSDPKAGWKALTLFDGKRKSGKMDPENEKLFSTCLKEAQDDSRRKSKPTYTSSSYSQRKPFRSGPGAHPGYSHGHHSYNYSGSDAYLDSKLPVLCRL